MNRLRCQNGFTLIELTVVLSVLVILTLAMTPTITDMLTEWRMSIARKEVRVIGEAVHKFILDTGFLPKTSDSIDGRNGSRQVDLLVSRGSLPRLPPTGYVVNSVGNAVNVDVNGWLTGSSDLIDNHLLKNGPGYRNKGGTNEFGWNGPYINVSEIPSDPWGNRYMINVRFLDLSPGVLDARGQVKYSVWVISAGPNGIMETPFAQPVTMGGETLGDDITCFLQ